MRRSFVTLLALLGIARSAAVGQTCMGLASFTAAPVQVTATGSYGDLSTSLGATVGYGVPASLFGSVGVATSSYEPIDGSSVDLAGRAGYQISIGNTRPVQMCPTASFGMGIGPSDDVAGFDRSSRAAGIGMHVGMEMTAGPRMKIVPTAGVSYAYRKEMAEDNAGARLYGIANSYGLAQLGAGIILNQNLSLRPSVDIPLGLEGSTPTVGLTLGYNFGLRGLAARPR